MMAFEQRLRELVCSDAWMMDILRVTASLALPDCWIGAGFVRARVWDQLQGHAIATKLEDVDVLYFETGDLSEATEKRQERRLSEMRPAVPWSVKNQARMHLRNGDRPYADTEDALRYWLETATCVAVALDGDDRLRVIAPYGLEDLFNMVLRPTPAGLRRAREYNARLAGKPWRRNWPQLRVVWAENFC
jgi:hypothetical protein